MDLLQIHTFGRLRVRKGDETVTGFETRKVEALLVYLACNRRAHPREVLADLLWDERSQRQAQANLRVVLLHLRKLLGEYFLIDRKTAALHPEAAVWLDAAELEKGLSGLQASGKVESGQQAAQVEQAAALYAGEFLAGFYVREARGFEDWVVRERERLHHLVVDALHELVDYELETGDDKPGLAHVTRLLELDPLMEAAHRQKMRLLAYSGRRNEALAQYEALKRILRDELGVQPSESTESLFRTIRAGKLLRPGSGERAIRGYEIREKIGQGSFGMVYRARQPAVAREVAVKVILPQYADTPQFIRRFEAEAQLIARLEHPHIVPLYDYWREPGGAYLVMRWLRGGSLGDRLAHDGPLEAGQLVRWVEQVAAGLNVAHQQGIIHRDLKPANILLDELENAYLSDFGIAKDLQIEGEMTDSGILTGSPVYMSPELIRSQPLTPRTDIYSLGVLLYELLAGEMPFQADSLAALIEKQLHEPLPSLRMRRPELPPAVEEVLRRATSKDPAGRYPDVLSFAAAFQAALNGAPLPAIPATTEEPALELINPYKGLRAFQEADAGDFFGREALVARLVARLLARLSPSADSSSTDGHGPESGRFLAVVGPSGSGKSSVVRAGLLPALRSGALPGSEQWFVVEMIPGPHPLEELEAALLRVAVNPPESLLGQLKADRRGLLRAVKRILPADEQVELLLILDQFEEVFTLVEDPSETRHFMDSLYDAVTEPRSRLRLVITLRADFYDRPLKYLDFSELLRLNTEVVLPLTPEELGQAIARPAQRAGAALEEGLVTQIVAEVTEQPGALPLLQYALTDLFERREGRMLTQAAYRQIGGVSGALGLRAEEIYQGLDPHGQEAARQLFLRLVTLGEGVEDTRRRVLRFELEGLEGIGDRGKGSVETVLDAYGRARLLSFDRDPLTRGPTVEVAHEALLREWRRLREWLEESREGLRLQRRLGSLAGEYLQAGKDPGFLLRDSRLDQFEAWASETDLALTAEERAYMQASLAERQARRAAEAERQAREAALERRSRRILRALVGVFAVAAVIAGLLSLFAFRQQRLARTNESIAEQNAAIADQNAATAVAARGEAEQLAQLRSREAQVNQSLALAAQAQLARQADNLELALALAWEANRIPDSPGQAQMALSEVAYGPGLIRVFNGHQALLWSVAVSPDGRYGLSGDAIGDIYLWDLETGAALRQLNGHEKGYPMGPFKMAFTPDGRHAVTASQDKTLVYWDLETGEILWRLEGHQDRVNVVAVSPDGRIAASGSGRFGDHTDLPYSNEDNSVSLWDLHSGQELRRFDFFTDGISGLDFTPDGRGLMIATVTDSLFLLDVETGKILVRPELFNELYLRVAVSPDGRHALSGSSFVFVVLDLETGEIVRKLTGNNSTVLGLDISPDGRRVLGGWNVLLEWDLLSGEEIQQFIYSALSVAYLPDGKSALIGSEDSTVRLLALSSGAEIDRFELPGIVEGVAYSPDGRTALIATQGSISAWDLESGENLWAEDTGSGYEEAVFSPDGKQMLVSEFASVTLREAATGTVLLRLESDGSFESPIAIRGVAFHPGGNFALAGAENSLIYWDLQSGAPVWLFDADDVVFDVAISPDGRTALSAEGAGSISWWDLETGQRLKRMEGHTNLVWGVSFVDDRTAISTSDDRTMILWDLESGAPLRTFLGHSDGIKRVALSPDKRLAISASRDGTAILWDVQTGEPLRRYTGHQRQLRTIAFHPNGKEALTGGGDQQAIRWRIDADLESFMEWVEHNRYVRALTCEEREVYNAEPLCTAEEAAAERSAAEAPAAASPVPLAGEALLPALPLPTPTPPEPRPAPPAPEEAGMAVRGVNVGSIPVGGGQVWDYAGTAGESLSIRAAAASPGDAVRVAARRAELGLLDTTLAVYAPDGSLLAQADDLENSRATDAYLPALTLPESGSYRIEVRSFQDQTGGDYRLVIGDPRQLFFDLKIPATAGLAVHPNGRTVLMGAGFDVQTIPAPPLVDYRIWVWDLERQEVDRYLEGHTNTPVDIAISPDGRQAVSIDVEGQVILWDLESWTELRRLEGLLENLRRGYGGVVFHPDGSQVLITSDDNALALWDVNSGEVVQLFAGHGDRVLDLALSPGGNRAYSTAWDNTLRVWDVAAGELLATYQPFSEGPPHGLAVSPGGENLLVGMGWKSDGTHTSSDTGGLIAILDVQTGEVLRDLAGHTATVHSIAFSPDGRYALSGSYDQTVRLWHVDKGEQLAVFYGHTAWVFEVAFSPDGLTGYSTGTDGTLRFWDLGEYIGGE